MQQAPFPVDLKQVHVAVGVLSVGSFLADFLATVLAQKSAWRSGRQQDDAHARLFG